MNKSTIAIFEEYCKSVKLLPKRGSAGPAVEVTIEGKYFTELYTRVMLHGWTCISVLSDVHDNHVATFVEGQFGIFDEKMGDELKDDDSDWWKYQD